MNSVVSTTDQAVRTSRILVTGATGRIGRYVVTSLKKQHCRIRAVTSGSLTAEMIADPQVEWIQHDFMKTVLVDNLIRDCDAILHLAGEVWNISRMQRLNVEATGALARAAAHAGIRFFGFTSSAAAYGTPRTATVTEDAPLLTPERDVRTEYRGNASLRAYGRSKVLAEREILSEADGMECIIFRPTVVVDSSGIRKILTRHPALHFVIGRRHEHLIYVEDVVAAMIWFLERALRRMTPQAGVQIYNVADDAAPQTTGAALLREAYVQSGLLGRHWWVCSPFWLYDVFEAAKNKRLSIRPAREFVFSTNKLFATGYVHPVGLEAALIRSISAKSDFTLEPNCGDVPATTAVTRRQL